EFALHPDLPAMQLHKLPAQGKPKPGALDLLRGRPHLAELLEDIFLVLWGDTNAGVADRDLHESFGTAPTSMRPSSGVNLMAFDNRFRTTWRTFRSSAWIWPSRSSMLVCSAIDGLDGNAVRARSHA